MSGEAGIPGSSTCGDRPLLVERPLLTEGRASERCGPMVISTCSPSVGIDTCLLLALLSPGA
eukprot:2255120-Prorocentrum_lima.AAC.1